MFLRNTPINVEWLATRNWWRNVDVGEPDECWLWLLSSGGTGYGQTWDRVTVRLAHRVAWVLHHGKQIPDGLTIDHICHVRKCCNPAHLRLLSNVDNARDNGNYRKTHCPKGHEYTVSNTILQPSNGSRKCRACQAARNRARYH